MKYWSLGCFFLCLFAAFINFGTQRWFLGFSMLLLSGINYYSYLFLTKNEEKERLMKKNLYELHEDIEKELQKRKIEELYAPSTRQVINPDSEESE